MQIPFRNGNPIRNRHRSDPPSGLTVTERAPMTSNATKGLEQGQCMGTGGRDLRGATERAESDSHAVLANSNGNVGRRIGIVVCLQAGIVRRLIGRSTPIGIGELSTLIHGQSLRRQWDGMHANDSHMRLATDQLHPIAPDPMLAKFWPWRQPAAGGRERNGGCFGS
jgi:hypothetical protein